MTDKDDSIQCIQHYEGGFDSMRSSFIDQIESGR